MALEKWEKPKTVTALRGFLGLTNYFAEYVPGYAEYAGPLMDKLQLNREDGKRGGTRPIILPSTAGPHNAHFPKLTDIPRLAAIVPTTCNAE